MGMKWNWLAFLLIWGT